MDRGDVSVLDVLVDGEPATLTVADQGLPVQTLELVAAPEAEKPQTPGQQLRDLILSIEVPRYEELPELFRYISPEQFRREAQGEFIEVETVGEPQVRRVQTGVRSWSWSCAIGNPDWCAEHRMAEGGPEGWYSVSEYARIFESFAQAMGSAGVSASALLEATSAAAAVEVVDEPANRRERRAALRLERQGRTFSREKLRPNGRDRWNA